MSGNFLCTRKLSLVEPLLRASSQDKGARSKSKETLLHIRTLTNLQRLYKLELSLSRSTEAESLQSLSSIRAIFKRSSLRNQHQHATFSRAYNKNMQACTRAGDKLMAERLPNKVLWILARPLSSQACLQHTLIILWRMNPQTTQTS